MSKARVLALYLPQFHPIPENDKWWGKGFTEWTNVGKASKMYAGHYQPRVPADLGYYDLRIPQVREEQADLAKTYGVDGFLYWHYWFGYGKQLMEMPLEEVYKNNSPNFPFALAWANASWKGFEYGKNGRNMLIEQHYPGVEDYKLHFEKVLKYFQDDRYVTVDEKPFFLVFQPDQLPNPREFIDTWQKLARENGLKGMHLVAQTNDANRIDEILGYGFDAVNLIRMYDAFFKERTPLDRALNAFMRVVTGRTANVKSYSGALRFWTGPDDTREDCYPSIYPGWDHTPRSGARGIVLHGATPELFEKHCDQVFESVARKPQDKNIVILKSWNEWAEGNHMEPDQLYGHGFLEALRNSLEKL